ncbi:hypothetical protein Ddc_19807 [Ditylenchus destructor]|nr:hypothetical protein Ddc_19807 [Ditylenchus destructor]
MKNALLVDSSASSEISRKSDPLAENDGPEPPPGIKSRLKRQNYGYNYYNYPSYNNYGYSNGYSNSPGYNNYYSSYGANNGYGNNYYSNYGNNNNGNGVTYNNNGIKTDYNTGYHTNGFYVSDGYDGVPYSEVPGYRIYYGSKDEGI